MPDAIRRKPINTGRDADSRDDLSFRTAPHNLEAEQAPSGATLKPARIIPAAEIGRVCRYCSGERLTLPGRGPHAADLQCISGGWHGGWLPRDEAERLIGEAV